VHYAPVKSEDPAIQNFQKIILQKLPLDNFALSLVEREPRPSGDSNAQES